MSSSRRSRLPLAEQVLAALFIFITPILLTYPLIGRLSEGFLGTAFVGRLAHSGVVPGDHLNNVYRFWLVSDAISHGKFRLGDPYAFALSGGARDPAFGWLFGPVYGLLSGAFNPPTAYNLLVLLGFTLTGTFTYLWLRRVGLSRLQATMGAVAFMVFPIMYDRFTGHLKAFFFWLMPLALWAAERARASRSQTSRSGWRPFFWGLGAGLVVAALITVIEPETGIYFWPLLLIYFLGRMSRRAWFGLGIGLAASIAYVLWFYASVIGPSIMVRGRPYEALLTFSPTVRDLFSRHYPPPGSERYIYPGVAALIAVYGAYRLIRADMPLGRKLAIATGPVVIAISLGPKAPLLGVLYRKAYFLLPPLRVVQTPGRLMFVLGPLIALGFGVALKRLSDMRAGWVLAMVIAGLLIIDGRAVFYQLSRPVDPSFFSKVKNVGGVLDLPITDELNFLSSAYNYEITLLPAPRVGGVSPVGPRVAVETLDLLRPLGEGEVNDESLDEACRLGVTHVSLWEDIYGFPFNVPPDAAPALAALRGSPRFKELVSSQGIHVFRLEC